MNKKSKQGVAMKKSLTGKKINLIFSRKKVLMILIFFMVLSGCGKREHYKNVFNEDVRHNTYTYDMPVDTIWVATEMAVLAEGFNLEKIDKNNMAMVATKTFKDDNDTVTLTLSVTARSEENGTTLYATANQTREQFHSSRNYDWLLIIPRPTGSTASNVKVGEETIEDREFYQKFFKTVEKAAGAVKKEQQ